MGGGYRKSGNAETENYIIERVVGLGADPASRRGGSPVPESDETSSVGGVRVEVAAGVAVVTIDRPEVRNAIGFATIDELGAALDHVLSSDAAVLVLRGGGDRAFVSGGDLKELAAIRTHDDAVQLAVRVRRLLDRIAAFPIPVIAALNGHALGGGAEVAIAADIRIAADDVRIGFNQVTLGIMPAWGGAERLAVTVGRSRAMLAIATGELWDAATAERWGLVDIVVPRASFDDEWRALAGRMAGLAPGTTRAVKSVIGAAVPSVHADLEADAADAFAGLWTSEAHWAAIDALAQKRSG
jgi:enoyl-CoA hydratase